MAKKKPTIPKPPKEYKTPTVDQIRAAYPDWVYLGGTSRRWENPLTGQSEDRRGMMDRYIAAHSEQYGGATTYQQISPSTSIHKRHYRGRNGKLITIPGEVRIYNTQDAMYRYLAKHPGRYMIVGYGVPTMGYDSGMNSNQPIYRVVLTPSHITSFTLAMEWRRFQDRLPEIFDTEQPISYQLEHLPEED